MPEPPSKQTLLVVDDEPDICEYVQSYFARKGIQVWTAHSGQEALALVEQQHPQLILLDIKMAGWDGLETLRRIRAVDARVPVIMLTRVDESLNRTEAQRLGAVDYLVKPISMRQAEDLILKHLASSTPGGSHHG